MDSVSIPEYFLEGDGDAHATANRTSVAFACIKAHQDQFPVQVMCRILAVAPRGYYEWCQRPLSNRAQEDARLLRLIRASCTANRGIYGAHRVFCDWSEAGETCTKQRVAALLVTAKLRVNQIKCECSELP